MTKRKLNEDNVRLKIMLDETRKLNEDNVR